MDSITERPILLTLGPTENDIKFEYRPGCAFAASGRLSQRSGLYPQSNVKKPSRNHEGKTVLEIPRVLSPNGLIQVERFDGNVDYRPLCHPDGHRDRLNATSWFLDLERLGSRNLVILSCHSYGRVDRWDKAQRFLKDFVEVGKF